MRRSIPSRSKSRSSRSGCGEPKPPAVDTAPIPPRRRPPPSSAATHELALLKALYARAAREGSAQLVTVAGEPGVGKSRLVREFRAFVDWQPERARWRQGRCLPYGEGITFWALGEIVKSQAGILESDSPHEASDKLAAAIGAIIEDPAERDWLKTRLALLVGASAPGAGGPAERSESFAAWRRFLEAVAGRPTAGPGLRGRALGRRGAARVRGVSRGLGGGSAVPGGLHDEA